MYYEGGGANIPTGIIAFGIDVLCGFWTTSAVLAGVKFLGKKFAKNWVTKVGLSLTSGAIKAYSFLMGVSINMAVGGIGKMLFDNIWSFTSIGGICGLILDSSDGNVDGVWRNNW